MGEGVRRYQNPDGSLIPQGKKRISKKERQQQEKARKEDEYKQRAKASLEKGSKTRRTNPKIAELDKVGIPTLNMIFGFLSNFSRLFPAGVLVPSLF